MSKHRILVIEDDKAIRRGIVDALRFQGYDTLESGDSTDGLEKALSSAYDLLLLDLILPGGDGFDILADVRKVRPTVPVVILTARGSEDDRVKGLDLGADDYVVKPFSIKELLARVRAVLRRSPERPRPVSEFTIPGGSVNLARCEVCFEDGRREELSEREAKLLEYLVSNAGRAISRDEILSRVWLLNPRGVTTRTIDMHVARLRDKLGDDPTSPAIVLTVRGTGYMFAGSGEVQ
jgi:DNA-binding response OmpR family regulator